MYLKISNRSLAREVIRVYEDSTGWCLLKFELSKTHTPHKLHLVWCASNTDVNDVIRGIELVKNECKLP